MNFLAKDFRVYYSGSYPGEFFAKTQAITDFTAAGAPQVLEWYTQAVKDARAAIGLK